MEEEIETTRLNRENQDRQTENKDASISESNSISLQNVPEEANQIATPNESEQNLNEAARPIQPQEEEKVNIFQNEDVNETVKERNSIENQAESKHVNNSENSPPQKTNTREKVAKQAYSDNREKNQRRGTTTLIDISDDLPTQQDDSAKRNYRRSLGDLPELDNISQKHKKRFMEMSRKQLLDRLEAGHSLQLQDLIQKLNELRVEEHEKLVRKYKESRDNVELEMQDTCN